MFQPHLQIKRQLLRGILEGRFASDRPLPTICTLAEKFEVSPATVQKAIHALSKEGVIKAKRGVGLFILPVDAQAVRSGHVGLLYPDNSPRYLEAQPYPGQVLSALRQGLRKAGLKMVPCPLKGIDTLIVTEHIRKQRLNGLLLFEVDCDALISELRELRLPMVSMDFDAYRHGISSVTFDNVLGAFQATKLLLENGHRHIVFMRPFLRNALKYNLTLDAIEGERFKGYRIAMQEADRPIVSREYESSRPDLQETLLPLLGRRPAPTAFVCVADWSAQMVAQEVQGLGYRVPEDISVVGFGDEKVEFAPKRRLTSVWVDHAGMGDSAARFLHQQMQGVHRGCRTEILPTKLALYDSVAQAPQTASAVMGLAPPVLKA